MSHQRSLEERRAAGEAVSHLPIVVGGRPELPEMEDPPADLCSCKGTKHHEGYCAAAVWREVVPQLVAAKLIDRVDRGAIEGYCVQVGRARALREEIEWEHEPARHDALTGRLLNPKTAGRRTRRKTLHEQLRAKTTRGVSANPLLAHEREAWKEARLLALDLGLSPVSRTKLVGKRPERRGLGALTGDLPERPPLRAVGAE
jgi:P27 family predicted phage terminase small subunit